MLPGFIELNPTELCNLQCDFCPRSQGYPNSNLHMSLETVDVIIDHLQEFSVYWSRNYNDKIVVSNTGRGEPTLHKYFKQTTQKLIDFRDSNPYVYLVTNTNGYKFEKHLDLYKQLDYVHYNIYYNYTYDDYLKFLEKYKSYPNIHVKRKKEDELSEPMNFTSRAGAIVKDYTAVLASDRKYGYCPKPFGSIFIDWNGDYILCCNDWVVMEPLDNVHNTSIIDFYLNNPKLQKYKKMLLKERRSVAPCNNCNFVGRSNPHP